MRTILLACLGMLTGLVVCGCQQQEMLHQAEAPNKQAKAYFETLFYR